MDIVKGKLYFFCNRNDTSMMPTLPPPLRFPKCIVTAFRAESLGMKLYGSQFHIEKKEKETEKRGGKGRGREGRKGKKNICE